MVRMYAVEISDDINRDAFERFENEWSPEQELVRCKDCKYVSGCDGELECVIKAGWFPVNPDWFCADGKRRDEGEESRMKPEKLMKVLEHCLTGKTVNCEICPYECYTSCKDLLANEVVALLKEHEAELSYREAKAITHTATKLDDATCPSCGNVVGEKIRTGVIGQSVMQVRWNYCRFCGQKLDWEGR